MMCRCKTLHKGFSLVELIVAMGLFATVMTISTTAYLVMINANRNAQSLSAGTNNLTYALEDMTRNIRTGNRYQDCSPTPGSSSPSFSFRDVTGALVQYSKVVSGNNATSTIVRTVNGGAPIRLTDELIYIKTLSFTCTGTSPGGDSKTGGDDFQAHVTIVVSGSIYAGPGRPPKVFDIETSATMRVNDLI